MPLEIISWRVVASGPTPKFVLKAPFATTNKGCMLKRQRRVYFGESTGFTDASIFDRTKLEVGFSTFGPAIVEERESTLVIPPEFNLTIEASGNMLLSRRI